jgi:hypothetical protein
VVHSELTSYWGRVKAEIRRMFLEDGDARARAAQWDRIIGGAEDVELPTRRRRR